MIFLALLMMFEMNQASDSRYAMDFGNPKIEKINGTDSDILLYSFLPKTQGKLITIVMLAGGDGSKMIGKIAPIHYEFANQMNGYGYAVFAIDYRNPNRNFLDNKWIDDIEIGIKKIKTNDKIDTNKILLAGFSMGGTNAIKYLKRDRGIKGLICYASPMKFTRPELLMIIDKNEMPIDLAKTLDLPILFFQGLDDSITTTIQSDEFIDSLKSNGKKVEYIKYERTKHGFTYRGTKGDRVEYNHESAYDSYRKVNEFIQIVD